jgi:hypothetical protein
MMRDISSVTQATSMKVGKVEPNIDTGALLAGAQFCDAYSIAVDDAALDARHAAERMWGDRRDGSRRCWPCAMHW